MIPAGFCQNNEPVFNSTNDDMISKFDVLSKKIMYLLELIEILGIEWLQNLDE